MRYYLVCGEKSGDLHASNLVIAIKSLDSQAVFRGFGGDDMKAAGVEIACHYREMAFMGFWEVVKNLPKVYRLISQCKRDISQFAPDAVILVDFAGFNLKIAAHTKKLGIKTFYYISPKIWAWNTSRVYTVKRLIDRMFVILPFEKSFYARFGYEVDYVGNPVMDAVKAFVPSNNFLKDNDLTGKKLIAILPGSRVQEIRHILKMMIEIEPYFPDYQFVVAGVSIVDPKLYAPALSAGLPVVFGQTYDLLYHAEAALVTSGTATLEAALFRVPQVVCYKTSALTYAIAKQLVNVKYISLPNLLLDRPLLRELLQNQLNVQNLRTELSKVLGEDRQRILEGYDEIYKLLDGERASMQTARQIVRLLKE